MLLPGRMAECQLQLDQFVQGYRSFRDWDSDSLRLIEPLRAMRYIHYIAWCARQAADGTGVRVVQNFGSAQYWRQELHDLEEQLERIRTS